MSGGDMANRDIDDLMEQTQDMQQVYREVKDVPITFGLADGPTGLIGKSAIVKRASSACRTACFLTLCDLRFVFFASRVLGARNG
ncbi:hypothetical protein ACEQPO_23990 [Bacillus sp. SL00103]